MTPAFLLHDDSDFPLVRFKPSKMRDGYSDAWCAEMDALILYGEPFVLVYPPMPHEEAQEDRKKRGIWLKAHRRELSRQCLAFISVEPDAQKRASLEAMLPSIEQAFGTPAAVKPSQEEAELLAHHVLSGGALADKT